MPTKTSTGSWVALGSGELSGERPLRILQVVEACGAGVGRHVRSLCAGLCELGHEVTLVYSPRRLDAAFRRFLEFEGREMYETGKLRFLELDMRRAVHPASDLAAARRLVGIIRREESEESEEPFDIVHGHSSKGGALSRVSGRLAGKPVVYTPHSLILSSPSLSRRESLVYGSIERLLGRFATAALISVSRGERNFISGLSLVPEERLFLVENGIEDSSFGLRSNAAREISSEDPLTFGCVMRFSPQKAPEILVDAFERLVRTMPALPIHLKMAGSGELLTETKHRAMAAGIGELVSFPGWQSEPAEFLRGLDAYVLSSLYEGGPYTLMEAMAAGLPVVSTEIFGANESVGRVCGNVLCIPGDAEALADGMRRLANFDEPGLLRASLKDIGDSNYEYASRNLRQKDSTRRTVEVYREVLRRRGRKRGSS